MWKFLSNTARTQAVCTVDPVPVIDLSGFIHYTGISFVIGMKSALGVSHCPAAENDRNQIGVPNLDPMTG